MLSVVRDFAVEEVESWELGWALVEFLEPLRNGVPLYTTRVVQWMNVELQFIMLTHSLFSWNVYLKEHCDH